MKRFVTDYQIDGVAYGGEVDALDESHAQMLCDQRGWGEKVAGVLYAVIPAGPSFGHKEADAMAAAFAETGYADDEAPEAEEFDRKDSH